MSTMPPPAAAVALPRRARTSLLRMLAGWEPPAPLPEVSPAAAAAWLLPRDLGPRAHVTLRRAWPALGDLLAADALAAAGENSMHLALLHALLEALPDVDVTLLKGAAVIARCDAHAWRTMSDVDVWIPAYDTRGLLPRLRAAGLRLLPPNADQVASPDSPISIYGECGVTLPGWEHTRAELHLTPFPGKWSERALAVDEQALWARRQAVTLDGRAVSCLSDADMLLHAATHLAINHQYDGTTLRSLLDIALLMDQGEVDWPALTADARRWRLGTVLWLALTQVRRLFGAGELEPVLADLQPGPLRRALLGRFLPESALLTPARWRSSPLRLLFLALLIDRSLV